MKPKKVLIAGAGIAGLTAGVYLLRAGCSVTILEKTMSPGGLVQSFEKDGFVFDTGPRAIGNAGILTPMLQDLGIDIPLTRGLVSTGILDKITHHDDETGVSRYLDSLAELFPESANDIQGIAKHIKRNTRLARVLNRLPNPYFKNPLSNFRYLFTEFIPWLPSFLITAASYAFSNPPIESALASLTENAPLRDMISQHFFKGTPTRFAFGYFENFLDYLYPMGGTGKLPHALAERFTALGGSILYDREIKKVIPAAKKAIDQSGEAHSYDGLLWTADLKALYRNVDVAGLTAGKRKKIGTEKMKLGAARAGESVFTVFLAVDEKPEYFNRVSRGHFIYTPSPEGLGELHRRELERLKGKFNSIDKETLYDWLTQLCARNSYEISIPALKDPSLAPAGKTGLVISILFDGELCELIEKRGWFEEFRERAADLMLETLNASVYPGIKDKIIFMKNATPLTLHNRFGTEGGAITGWSLEERPPVCSSLLGIQSSVTTSIPSVWKAGQWAYSPSGVPIAILTGRIAAASINNYKFKLQQIWI